MMFEVELFGWRELFYLASEGIFERSRRHRVTVKIAECIQLLGTCSNRSISRSVQLANPIGKTHSVCGKRLPPEISNFKRESASASCLHS
jgi:hypothetical protein